MLWGLGVGYVISGMYFGWNLGLAEGGTYGLAIATVFIINRNHLCFRNHCRQQIASVFGNVIPLQIAVALFGSHASA